MNYAWGLEFVELTNGLGGENKLGLHGNAILSKYCLSGEDAFIIRDGLEKWVRFEEKRVGGRMGVFVPIITENSKHFLLGSIHKLERTEPLTAHLAKQNVVAAIVGGTQVWGFCEAVGISHADLKNQTTWKANLKSTGAERCDLICASNSLTPRLQKAATIIPRYDTEDPHESLWKITRKSREKLKGYIEPETILLSEHALTVSVIGISFNRKKLSKLADRLH
eukprot:GHVN01074300.1.p1 GENE.GHVN01074300.1~~GHVN01074300.1.p1  ORF type:complete len:223 (-),score=23.72 GHVN01074300.1:506-1174(-)